MNIKLNVKKTTFEQYLLELGFNYKIIQYDNFIRHFGRIIQRSVLDSIHNNTLEEIITEIFEKDIGILFLSDINKITNINPEYLKTLFRRRVFNNYIEDINISDDEEIFEANYLKNRIENLVFNVWSNTKETLKNNEEFKSLFIKNSSIDKKIKKLKNIVDMEISNDRKIELDNKIKDILLTINNEEYREEHTFRLREYGFSNGTNLNIDFDKLKKYVYSKIKDNLCLNDEIESYFNIIHTNTVNDIKIRSEINKRLFNIKDNDKEGLINVISFLSYTDYNKSDYTHNVFRYLGYNSTSKHNLYWVDFNKGKSIFDKLRCSNEFSYIADMENLIVDVLKTISFDLEVLVNDKKVIITFKEMKENNLIS